MGPRRSILTGIATIAACGMPGFLVAALAPPLGTELGLGEAGLGLAFAVFWGSGALGSSPGGRVAQRLGWVRSIQLATGLVAASCLLIAAFAGSPPALVGLLAVGGLGNSLALPAVSLLFSEAIGRGRQGTAFGISQSGAPTAALVAGLALPVVALPLGWRWAFVGAALAALALAAAVNGERRRHAHPAPVPPAGAKGVSAALVVMTVAAFLGTMAAGSGNGFLVISAVDAGFSEATAGVIFALSGVIAVATRVGLGPISDRPGMHRILIVTVMLAAGGVGFALLGAESRPLFLLGALLATGAGWGWLGVFFHAVVGYHSDAPGAATGVANTGLLAGGCAGPLIFGLVAARTSLDVAWLLAAGSAVAAAATMLLGRHLIRRGDRRAGFARFDQGQTVNR